MNDSTLLTVLIVFVALCALSQLGQFLALFGLYRKVTAIQEEWRPLIGKSEVILSSAKDTLDDGRKQMLQITKKTNEILDSAQSQLTKIDLVVTDASARAKAQMDRVETIFGDTVDRVQGVINATQEGVMKPVREVNALVTGIKSGFGFLLKSRRPSVVHATQDEEMFI